MFVFRSAQRPRSQQYVAGPFMVVWFGQGQGTNVDLTPPASSRNHRRAAVLILQTRLVR